MSITIRKSVLAKKFPQIYEILVDEAKLCRNWLEDRQNSTCVFVTPLTRIHKSNQLSPTLWLDKTWRSPFRVIASSQHVYFDESFYFISKDFLMRSRRGKRSCVTRLGVVFQVDVDRLRILSSQRAVEEELASFE